MLLIKTKIGKSNIEGIGLFSEDSLPKGTKIWEFSKGFDLEITPDQYADLPDGVKRQIDHYAYKSLATGNFILCMDDARFFNHDRNSNVVCLVPENSENPEALECFTTRDVAAGEEITNNYAEFDHEFDENHI